jgi:hypothetical protein
MITSILIAVSAGITLIIQSIALVRCRALKCVREKADVETEVELTHKANRPRLQTITNYDDEEL